MNNELYTKVQRFLKSIEGYVSSIGFQNYSFENKKYANALCIVAWTKTREYRILVVNGKFTLHTSYYSDRDNITVLFEDATAEEIIDFFNDEFNLRS